MTEAGEDPEGDVVLRLPDAMRDEFKDPLGPVFTDAETLLADAGRPVITVGDVVTYHLRRAGHRPHLAVVDGYTERERADEAVRESVLDGDREVVNPPATLTADLLTAIRAAFDEGRPSTVVVDGEEDLATLPAVLSAPLGASVVYGQPGRGMVLVPVDEETRDRVNELFSRLTGDHQRALALLEVTGN